MLVAAPPIILPGHPDSIADRAAAKFERQVWIAGHCRAQPGLDDHAAVVGDDQAFDVVRGNNQSGIGIVASAGFHRMLNEYPQFRDVPAQTGLHLYAGYCHSLSIELERPSYASALQIAIGSIQR